MFKLQRTRIQNKQFAVNISDTPVTLKQSQGHKTWNDIVDHKQGHNHAKFDDALIVSEKHTTAKKKNSNKEICQLSLLNMCKNQK